VIFRAKPTLRQARGQRAEDAVARHLARRGHRVLARNYRTRFGEIDLVTRDGPALVFVEVRMRGKGARVSGTESVDAKKKARIARAAAHYLAAHGDVDADSVVRFDVVGVETTERGYAFDVVEAAFELDPESLYA